MKTDSPSQETDRKGAKTETRDQATSTQMLAAEVWVVPFFGQGHLFPTMELCKHMASRNIKITLIISSNVSSSVPSSFRLNPLFHVVEIPPSPPTHPDPTLGPHHHINKLHADMVDSIESLLSTGPDKTTQSLFAVIDFMMGWTIDIFKKFDVPTIGFNTSGACSAALEYAMWKAHPLALEPGETRLLPGLPEEMAVTYSDLKRRPRRPGNVGPPGRDGPGGPGPSFPPGPPGGSGTRKMGPPSPGEEPPWVEDFQISVAFMMNTSDDLEGPFIDYIAKQLGKPVWGVGPLLPEEYWKSADSLLHDREIRSNRRSSVTEDEVIEWLDSKPHGSVLYVSFGSEVSPSMQEFAELADALASSNWPFIWVIQPGSGRPGPPRQLLGLGDAKTGSAADEEEGGFFPHGLDKRVGKRAMIIRGWAPQLLILSHPSTGGFLSHCGWNSTVEAIGRGVPFLAWPIRGDQFYNAKLVVGHLKVGCMISNQLKEMVRKDDISKGIQKLMGDGSIRQRALMLSGKFQGGFSASSGASFDDFRAFVLQK